MVVITSYSIHYTKLYDIRLSVFPEKSGPESAQKLLECIKHNARITQTVYTQTREERKKREEHLLGKAKKEQSREIAKVNDRNNFV